MSRLSLYTLAITGLVALVVCVSRGMGQQNQPLNEGLFITGNCAQPCWHGIQIGKTTLDEAEAILRAEPQFVSDISRENPVVRCSLQWTVHSQPIFYGCVQTDKQNVITWLWLESYWMHDGVSLNDALPALGSPTRTLLCWAADGAPITLYFTDYVEVGAWDDGDALNFPSADGLEPMVWYIQYTQPGSKPAYKPDTPYWQGFTDWHRYIDSKYKYFTGEC